VAAINPLFMVALIGTALACLALAVISLFMWGEPFPLGHQGNPRKWASSDSLDFRA